MYTRTEVLRLKPKLQIQMCVILKEFVFMLHGLLHLNVLWAVIVIELFAHG